MKINLTGRYLIRDLVFEITYWVMCPMIYLISLIPFSVSNVIIGHFFYSVIFKVFKYRYNIVMQNLSRSFPAKSYEEINHLAKEFYRHFACMLVEIIKLFSISKKHLLQKVKVVNPELVQYYYQQNRPIIGLLGHCGNWEYLNILPEQMAFPVNAIYKPLSNKTVDKLVKRIRTRFNMQLIPMQQALRYLIKQKDAPGLSLFIADQCPGANAKCRFNFLNQLTYMFDGAEKLAKAIDAVVLYVDMQKKPGDVYEVKFSLITESPKQNKDQEITKLFTEKLQETISCNPSNWLWSHRRWKIHH